MYRTYRWGAFRGAYRTLSNIYVEAKIINGYLGYSIDVTQYSTWHLYFIDSFVTLIINTKENY